MYVKLVDLVALSYRPYHFLTGVTPRRSQKMQRVYLGKGQVGIAYRCVILQSQQLSLDQRLTICVSLQEIQK